MEIYFDENIQDEIVDAGTPVWIVKMVLLNQSYSLYLESELFSVS